MASFLDITKQKKIEKELLDKESLLMQQSKMAQMGEMLENIAHQWRQPLSVISTSATGIMTQKEFDVLTDQVLEESLQSITRSVEHLSQTVDDFRGFYKDHKHPTKFRLDRALEKAISLVSSSFRKNNIIFIKDLIKIEILGYENELIQVFINIINNAKDELEKIPSKQRYLFVSINKDDENIIISFKDNANGIDEKVLPRIFENHFTTKTKNGTGIGLYMSKLIVEKSNGEIKAYNTSYEYDSKTMIGASFDIILPL